MGFGHLMRCRTLARVLGVTPVVAIRGGRRAKRVARQTGWRVITHRQLWTLPPSVVVIDEPSGRHTRAIAERARHCGHRPVPIAGLALMPSYSVVDPSLARLKLLRDGVQRPRSANASAGRTRVLIALGGGAHVFSLAGHISRVLAERVEGVTVVAAAGFAGRSRKPALTGGRWISAPAGLKKEFARATVAIVAGGVTLQEACAAGVPAVALPVVPAQRPAIRWLAARGAVVAPARVDAVGPCVARLIADRRRRRRLSSAGRRAVDGRGALRLAQLIREVADAA